MGDNANNQPSMSNIAEIQNDEESLRYRLAAAHFYKIGKLLHFGGASVTIALAIAAPLVLLFWPDAGPILGALAGAWIFASRLILEPFKRELQLKGATAQEQFDCRVLGIAWNDALVRRLPHEDVSAASRSMKGAAGARDWYAADDELPWPMSVLLCQRSNAVWARRQHRAYSWTVVGAAVGWAVVGVVVAIADSASLAQYLVTVALPSLPAFLDASELSRGHAAAAQSRQLLEVQTDDLLRASGATERDVREIQDQLFNLRRDAPLVPEWFYKLIRPRFEEDMRYAAQQVVKQHAPAGSDSARETNDG